MLQPPRGSTSYEYTREAEGVNPTTAEVVVMKRCCGRVGFPTSEGEGCCGRVGFPTSIDVVEGWGSPHPLLSISLLLLLLLQCPKERGGEERGSSPASEQVSMKLKREGATERVMRQ